MNKLFAISPENRDIEERPIALRDQYVICLSSKIVKPNQVSENIVGDCSPYLYKIVLTENETLWERMKINKRFDSSKFLQNLKDGGKRR